MATENNCSSAAGSKRPTVSPSSIGTLGDDQDLLAEILIRLPSAKSAIRCKSISKGWNALISAPYFSRRFVSHRQSLPASESEHRILTPSQVRQSISSFLPFPPGAESKFSVLDSVNDLLLLGFWGPDPTDQELRRTHLVCNPFTKQWAALPLSPKLAARPSRRSWIVKLVCGPFNPSDDGPRPFRVVRMHNPRIRASSPADVELYMLCSTSGRWTKSVLRRLDGDLRCRTKYRVVSSADGQLYWLNHRREAVKWDPFRPADNTAATSPTILCRGGELNRRITCYGPWVSGGAVHVVCKEPMILTLSLWRLEEEGGGCWRKQCEVRRSSNCVIRIDGTAGGGEAVRFEFGSVVGLHPTKPEIVFLMAYRRAYHPVILSWNFRTDRLQVVADQDKEIGLDACRSSRDDLVFQPRVALWPSWIPSYEKLRNAYDGSYDCWHPVTGPNNSSC